MSTITPDLPLLESSNLAVIFFYAFMYTFALCLQFVLSHIVLSSHLSYLRFQPLYHFCHIFESGIFFKIRKLREIDFATSRNAWFLCALRGRAIQGIVAWRKLLIFLLHAVSLWMANRYRLYVLLGGHILHWICRSCGKIIMWIICILLQLILLKCKEEDIRKMRYGCVSLLKT